MTTELTQDMINKLSHQKVIWLASVRSDHRPHLAPIWFVWHQENIYISTDPKSIKSGNLRLNPHVSLALEEGTHPLICEGIAEFTPQPWDADLLDSFFLKYEWDVTQEKQYNEMWAIKPVKWLAW